MKPTHEFETLKQAVEIWAYERNLLDKFSNAIPQMSKVYEEVGELNQAVHQMVYNTTLHRYEIEPDVIDGIGDSLVTLIILAAQLGYDPVFCLEQAYAEIKDRKGKTVNGTFIKDK